MKKTCLQCRQKYEAARSDQYFCSPRCRYRYNHPEPEYLILPIKKKWFDMILSGEKKEEYREIKSYWEKRFKKYFNWNFGEDEIFEWHFLQKTTENQVSERIWKGCSIVSGRMHNPGWYWKRRMGC